MIRFCFIIACLLINVVSWGYDFSDNNIYYNIISQEEKTCEVTFKTSTAYSYVGDVIVPSYVSYNGIDYKVIGIGTHTFYCCKMYSVQLPETIEYIGSSAFMSTYNLSSIVIPKTVTKIEENAFHSSKSLKHVEIQGEGLKEIGSYAFYNCSLLEEFIMPNSVVYIGEYCFSNYGLSTSSSNLQKVHLSEQLETIPCATFDMCNQLLEIIIPQKVKTIEEGAFANCGLTKIELPKSVEVIKNGAFRGCNKLTELHVPNSVKVIGERAFAGSSSGTGRPTYSEVEIGNGVTSCINIFNGFNSANIRKIIFGEGIKEITDGIGLWGFGDASSPYSSQHRIFLLTDNIVTISGISTPRGGTCNLYVADSTKYDKKDIDLYGIKNLIASSSYNGEYNGLEPNINLTCCLDGYNVKISPEYFNAGTYTKMKLNFSREDFSSTITVPCNYTITKAPLTITPYDVTITYGEDIPTFNCLYQGLKNNETSNYALSKSPTVTTSAVKGSNAGTYKLYASGAEAQNYSISYKTGTLTIKPAQQTINWNQTFENILSDSKVELKATSSCGLIVQYSTSDPSIAYITLEGGKSYLNFCKDGNVVITASQAGSNNYSAATSVSKTIVVMPRMATGINLNSSYVDLKVGENYTLIPTITPATTIDKSVEWKSLDNTIATVDNGIVHALKLGETTIQVTTKDGSNLTASCKIVVSPTLVSSITLSKSQIQLILGNSETISATVLPISATNKELTWEVNDKNIASIDNGLITALAIGNTIVTAKAKDGSGVYATCSVVVNPIAVSSIELSPITSNVDVGENITLTATVYPANASNKQLLWQSSNNDVATVIDGIVTGIKPGNVIITAKATDGSNKTATASITVNKIKASNIYVNKTSTKLFVGDEETIIATISPSDATIKDVIWSTSNANVATVVNGLVKANGNGIATITAVTTDGTNLSATCLVTVEKRTQTISWNQYIENIKYGGQLVELTATASSGLKVKYKSNDENVVSIFDLGDIVYLNPGNCGKTSVIAYQEGNNEYMPTETTQSVEVLSANSKSSKALIAYYSQSALMDGIVAELANQIAGSGSSVYIQKIEPVNNRINEANTNKEVRDSVMDVIGQYPDIKESYPSINSIGVNVNDYDDIIMVYPLWNSRMAAPMQTFSFTYNDVLKKKSVAYIEYDLFGDAGASSNAKALRLNAYNIENKENIIKEWLRNSEATGILQLHKDRNRTVEGIYDLQGRKVSTTPMRGVYIEGGRKIVR